MSDRCTNRVNAWLLFYCLNSGHWRGKIELSGLLDKRFPGITLFIISLFSIIKTLQEKMIFQNIEKKFQGFVKIKFNFEVWEVSSFTFVLVIQVCRQAFRVDNVGRKCHESFSSWPHPLEKCWQYCATVEETAVLHSWKNLNDF